MKNESRFRTPLPRYQAGVLTTFTGVLVLVMLTLMMFFAIRVGVFEQRVSSNEMRQKRAFHAAESGIQHAKEFFRANAVFVASNLPDMLADGTDGWLVEGAERWQPCSGAEVDGDPTNPCHAEPDPNRRAKMYYWSVGDEPNIPLNTDAILQGGSETVQVQALLCILRINPGAVPPVQCDHIDPLDVRPREVDGTRYMLTLLSRGQSDCAGGQDCSGEAIIREQVANFGGAAGGQAPAVPLTTKNAFPPSGAAEVVANPNGGGIGVPISVWMNRNPACTPDGSAINPSQGSWATCEAHEWYELDSIPDDVECPGACSCGLQESLSYTHGQDDILGIDLVQDEEFPCDLFQFYFGTPRINYESVKGFAKVLTNCDSLGPSSSGIYWISGAECTINANTVIGSPYAPVLLISAASATKMAGGTKLFGVLYVSDVELGVGNAEFEVQGNNIVYGQVIMDADYGNNYNGTFQVIYNENLIARVTATGGLGNVPGGWADYHPASWEGWQ